MSEWFLKHLFNKHKNDHEVISGQSIKFIMNSLNLDINKCFNDKCEVIIENNMMYDFEQFKYFIEYFTLKESINVKLCHLRDQLLKHFDEQSVKYIILTVYGNLNDDDLVNPLLINDILQKVK